MNVLALGATGLVGGAMVERVFAAGWQTMAATPPTRWNRRFGRRD